MPTMYEVNDISKSFTHLLGPLGDDDDDDDDDGQLLWLSLMSCALESCRKWPLWEVSALWPFYLALYLYSIIIIVIRGVTQPKRVQNICANRSRMMIRSQ